MTDIKHSQENSVDVELKRRAEYFENEMKVAIHSKNKAEAET